MNVLRFMITGTVLLSAAARPLRAQADSITKMIERLQASVGAPPATPTTVAFKSGEATTGQTKQCFYSALGNAYTLTVGAIDLCPLSAQVRLPAPQAGAQTNRANVSSNRPSVVAFKTGEQTTGMTKQCFYDALGSSYTKTINSVGLCPLSLQVPVGRP
jgi:hypothetical protein